MMPLATGGMEEWWHLRQERNEMIVWSGLGFLVPLIALVCIFVMNQLVGDATFHGFGWLKAVALFVSAVLVTLLGFFLKKQPDRVMIDKATGQEMAIRSRHSVFFIPVIYWGAIYAAIGVYYLFAK